MNAGILHLIIISAVVGLLPALACKQAPTEQPKQAEQVVKDELEEITVVDTKKKAIEVARREMVKIEGKDYAEKAVYIAFWRGDRWEVHVATEEPTSVDEYYTVIISSKGKAIEVTEVDPNVWTD